MRTSHSGGASPRRSRSGAGLLAAGLLAVGLSAFVAVPASASTLPATYPHHFDWEDYVSHHDRWTGGTGSTDGVRFTWPTRTVDYDGAVCPDMDLAKIDTTGDPLTITLVAPEGKLISAYCVKSGSDNQDLGPKIVELDEPAAEVTIAYAAGGKCKAISHYSVAYVDAPQVPGETSPTPTPAGSPTPVTPTRPLAPAPAAPAPALTPTPTPTPSPAPSVAPSATPSGSASPAAVAAPVPSPSPTTAGRLAATDDAPRVAATGDRLAFTGAQVTGFLVGAVVLVMLGSLAVHLSRRRAAQR